MSKKPKRSAPLPDMTAMVDVAFLLLTFFILTTTSFRQEAPLEVEMPSSVSQTPLPEKGLFTVSVGDSGQVFIGFSDIKTREDALKLAATEKNWTISEEGLQYFSGAAEFGVPMEQIPAWLNLTNEERKNFKQPGMSAVFKDSVAKTGNDLREWVRYARLADNNMRFAIKGDVDAKYFNFKDIVSTMQDWQLNQFALITDLEKGGEEAEPKKK